MKWSAYSCLTALAFLSSTEAAKNQPPPTKDVVDKASQIASIIVKIYNDNENPYSLTGIVPDSDWAVSSTALWSSLIEYWHYTGKDAYNSLTWKALAAQAGNKQDFDRNFTKSSASSHFSVTTADQGLWGSVALLAAERDYPQPETLDKSWIEMAQSAFELFASYWNEDKKCGGGIAYLPEVVADNLHPSIPDRKDMYTNGAFFSMAARLARFTDDKKYTDWADKSWAWVEKVGLINTKTYAIKESLMTIDCKLYEEDENSEEVQSNAFMVLGSAFMYNATEGDTKWKSRVQGLADHALSQWFEKTDGILTLDCEEDDECGSEWDVFKGLSISMYAQAVQVAPFLKDTLYSAIIKSGSSAMYSCKDHEEDGEKLFSCGFRWAAGTEDDADFAPFNEIAALNAVAPLLMDSSKPTQQAKDDGAIDSSDKSDKNSGSGKGDDDTSGAAKTSISVLGVLGLGVMAGLL